MKAISTLNFKNPNLWLQAGGAAGVGLGSVVLVAALASWSGRSLAGVTIGKRWSLPTLLFTLASGLTYRYRKELVFHAGLVRLYRELDSGHLEPFTRIALPDGPGGVVPTKIYLGILPIQGFKPWLKPWLERMGVQVSSQFLFPFQEGYKEQGQDARISHIMAVVQKFELRSPLVQLPTLHEIQGDSFLLSAEDYEGVPLRQMINGVDWLENRVDQGVYLHCKSGKGRSAQILLGYMLKQALQREMAAVYNTAGYKTADDAVKSDVLSVAKVIELIKAQRPISLNASQVKAVEAYRVHLIQQWVRTNTRFYTS